MKVEMVKAKEQDEAAIGRIREIAGKSGLDVAGGSVLRTSSRFCLGVEHGDYNGTELFGIGTDRFIWLAYKPNGTGRVRLYSDNFPDDGVVEFEYGSVPEPRTVADSWGRFAFGVEYILRKEGYKLGRGFDAVLYGNIPGGGMSRSASLALNLILTMLEVNGIEIEDGFKIVDLAVAVENEYIGSPCGQLDQIMILFAKEGMGTHYNPKERKISYVKLGEGAEDFCVVGLDTGTKRPGLEKSTYKVRRGECEELVRLAQGAGIGIQCLADVRDEATYNKIMGKFEANYVKLCKRLTYIYKAQKRFYEMLEAWKRGDIRGVGEIFRLDGLGLRDEYEISGPELESMCDITRTVDGVLGERMLGGGDKGASGALVLAGAVEQLRAAVGRAYPLSHPEYADKYAVHVCKSVTGVGKIEVSSKR